MSIFKAIIPRTPTFISQVNLRFVQQIHENNQEEIKPFHHLSMYGNKSNGTLAFPLDVLYNSYTNMAYPFGMGRSVLIESVCLASKLAYQRHRSKSIYQFLPDDL